MMNAAPRRPGRFAMRLPSLTYALTLTTDCDENWQANSVLISVADSRVSFDAEKLREDTSLEFKLQIPSDQIAPLRIENFCVTFFAFPQRVFSALAFGDIAERYDRSDQGAIVPNWRADIFHRKA